MSCTADVMKEVIATVATGAALNEADAERAFEVIMSGEATPSQIGGFLMALRVRGETVEEITGAARAMRAKAARIEAPADSIDTCGTAETPLAPTTSRPVRRSWSRPAACLSPSTATVPPAPRVDPPMYWRHWA